MNKHFAANFFNLLIVLMIGIAGVVFWGKAEFYRPGPLQEAIFVEVPRGGSVAALSDALSEQGAISNGTVMRLGSRYLEKNSQLKFGNYEIPAQASISDILDIVTKGGRSRFRYVARYNVKIASPAVLTLRERSASDGENIVLASFVAGEELPEAYAKLKAAKKPISYQISVPEGATSWQIIEALNAADFLDGPALTVSDEGRLAPDTVEVRAGALRSDVIQDMKDAQTEILAHAWAEREKGLPFKSPDEALILASIVEKETGVKSERAEVAGVFINRLNKGMRLQTDPTVIYGLTEGKAPLGRGLRRSELSKKTAYNTYIIPALPPGPIANPGRKAIEAVMNPAATDNLYFVADGTGGHAFAASLREHNANVIKWRKIEAERRKAAKAAGNN
ncbi:MAG: endolytic transglycosylase MltG [Proteobacteria bacterium]|nr:endolytic transglycosylase MltG [Pseudomonadota bacterium]